jgi:hypothetical protein
MNIQTILLIILAILVVLAIGLIVSMIVIRLRSHNLRTKYGPEYDYTLETTGDRRAAEIDLHNREKRVNDLNIHPLTDTEVERYHQEWIDIQASFIDNPLAAAENANRAITEVMIARGFPVENFDERSEDLSVLYPEFIPGYREANSALAKNHEDGVSIEDLRQAMIKFHLLFDELLDVVHHQEKIMEAAS